MSKPDVGEGKANSKRKDISPLESRLNKTRTRSQVVKKVRRGREEYFCPSDEDLDSVLIDRSDTCYIMATSSPQTSNAQDLVVPANPTFPIANSNIAVTSTSNSLIQSRVQYQFPTNNQTEANEAIRNAVRAAEINMQMKHQEELDTLRKELQALKLNINQRNINIPTVANSSSTGTIPKKSGTQVAPNIPTSQTTQTDPRTNLINSYLPPIFPNIPMNVLGMQNFIPSNQAQVNNLPQSQIPIFNQPPPPYLNQNQRNPNTMPSFNESMGSVHQRVVPIHKWKIRYNGDGSVSNFLFQVNTLRRKNNYDEEEVFNNFDLLLEGRAERFYWSFIQKNPGARYMYFVRAFSIEFGSTEKDCMIMANMAQKRQGYNESFITFLEGMRDLLDRMEYPIPDASFVSLVKSNCKPELSNLLFALPIYSKEALSRAGRDAEQQLSYQNRLFKTFSNRYDNRRNISEIETEDLNKIEELEAQINSLKVQNFRNYKHGQINQKDSHSSSNNDAIIQGCFNCFDLSHYQRDCPKEVTEIYCFTCGTRGVITPKCPKCRSKNLKKDGVMMGAQRQQ